MKGFRRNDFFHPHTPHTLLNDFAFTRENPDFRLCGRVGSSRKMKAKLKNPATLVTSFFNVVLGYNNDFGPLEPVFAHSCVHGVHKIEKNRQKSPKSAKIVILAGIYEGRAGG